MVNKAIIIGHVGQDPEVRYTGNASDGAKVATIRVATTERYNDREGNLKEQTEWHSIVCWRSTADVVEKYVKKGTQVYVEGKLRTRNWEQNGVKHYATDIVADTIRLLGKKEQNRDPYISGAQQMQAQRPQTTPLPTIDPNENPTDDLPF